MRLLPPAAGSKRWLPALRDSIAFKVRYAYGLRRREVTARSARLRPVLAALVQELTKLGPVPIIADALGFHPATIELHAVGSASTYTEYMAAMRDLNHP